MDPIQNGCQTTMETGFIPDPASTLSIVICWQVDVLYKDNCCLSALFLAMDFHSDQDTMQATGYNPRHGRYHRYRSF